MQYQYIIFSDTNMVLVFCGINKAAQKFLIHLWFIRIFLAWTKTSQKRAR